MSRTLVIRNRQRVRRVHTLLLRRIALHVLQEQLRVGDFELALHLVAAAEMARVNQTFLDHEGSTDVVTFDHSSFVTAEAGEAGEKGRNGAEKNSPLPPFTPAPLPAFPPAHRPSAPASGRASLNGELFLCLDDAVKQAREFHTTWQSELVRYVIHGLLHLCGHDDLNPSARRRMKREENRLLREIAKQFPLARLGTPNLKPGTADAAFRVPRSAI
jgi:probable rRNA maturation factor